MKSRTKKLCLRQRQPRLDGLSGKSDISPNCVHRCGNQSCRQSTSHNLDALQIVPVSEAARMVIESSVSSSTRIEWAVATVLRAHAVSGDVPDPDVVAVGSILLLDMRHAFQSNYK